MTNINIVYVPIKQLKPSEYNPRKWNEKIVADIKKSITNFGIVDPIIVNSAKDRKNIVIGGHLRLFACKELGYKEVPVVYVNIPDIKKEQELNIRLNKNQGEWDFDLLANIDEDILVDIGFDSKELDKVFQLEAKPEDDDVPEISEAETICKTGDLYQLGNHRLMCGDCTVKENVDKLMDGKKADMVFTDPPYGIGLDTDYTHISKNWKGHITSSRKYKNIIGDDKDFNSDFILQFFDYCKEIFLWGAENYYVPKGGWFVWDKTQGKTQVTVGSEFELCWSKQKHKKQILLFKWSGVMGLQTQDIRHRIHPTQKPVEVCKWFIDKFSKQEQNVVDLFGGSGSTMIACEKTNRKCYMVEIDERYADVIIARWEKFTGGKATKL